MSKPVITRDEERWEVEVKAEIPAESLEKYSREALKDIQKTATIAGFRPGKAPESEIIRVYGDAAILRRAAEHAIQHELPEILAKEALPVIEAPKVSTETPVAGKPLKFTARAALAPEIKLPDYRKVAQRYPADTSEVSVSDAEHAEAMIHLRRERARIDKFEAGKTPAEASGEARAMDEKDLPALDDEFAKTIGYESIDAFHGTVRENMKSEKARAAHEKRRAAILDELTKESSVRFPIILREYELDDIEARLASDLKRSGTTLDAYLTQMKKTKEELRNDWKDGADKRAKIRLILAEIARQEHIEADQKTLDDELQKARKHYPDANPDNLRAHIAHALRNESVLKFLESIT